MRKKLLAMSCLLVVACSYVSGKDLYVYKNGSTTATHSLKNVKKIIFNSSEMNVIAEDASITPVEFTDFDFFSFTAKGSSTAIQDLNGSKDVSVRIDGSQVVVESEKIISSIQFYSVQGIVTERIVPMSSSYILSLSSYPSGVYMMKVKVDGKEVIQKIIVK